MARDMKKLDEQTRRYEERRKLGEEYLSTLTPEERGTYKSYELMRAERGGKRNVQIRREELGLSQRQVAIRAGISGAALTGIERSAITGYIARKEVYERLAEALNTSVEFIMADQPRRVPCESCSGKGYNMVIPPGGGGNDV